MEMNFENEIKMMKKISENFDSALRKLSQDFKIIDLKMKLGLNDNIKVIDGFENYAISDKGKIYNLKFKKEIRSHIRGRYIICVLPDNQGQKSFLVSRLVAMHFLENPENKPCVDHINNDKFNNDVKNLRWATHAENLMNKSKHKPTSSIYKGVSYECNMYRAYIRINRIKTSLGSFKSETDAAKAYNNAAIKHFGEFAKLNII